MVVVTVYGKSLCYTTYSKEDSQHDHMDLTTIYDCKITQTPYGSVIIIRNTYQFIVELYPQSIKHIIHK